MDVTAYLRRIAYPGPLTPSLSTLRALHVAHLLAVPFENLSIHEREPIVLDDDALFEKIVTRRRGGFCYELNGLFAALLRELGFDVAMLSAGVMSATGEFGPEFDHMTLLVRPRDDADAWLADVGFGDSFREPMRLRDAEEQAYGVDRWQLTGGGERWLLSRCTESSPMRPQYRFTTTPRCYADFLAMCAFHQTSPESPFTRQRVCTIATGDGRVTLAGMRLITSRGGSKAERTVDTGPEFRDVLRDNFEIVV